MRSLFPWTEVSKAVQKPNGGQEVPEIALSVGSKLELLRALWNAKSAKIHTGSLLSLSNVLILPRTLTHLSAYACILHCIYYIHDRGAEGFAL